MHTLFSHTCGVYIGMYEIVSQQSELCIFRARLQGLRIFIYLNINDLTVDFRYDIISVRQL